MVCISIHFYVSADFFSEIESIQKALLLGMSQEMCGKRSLSSEVRGFLHQWTHLEWPCFAYLDVAHCQDLVSRQTSSISRTFRSQTTDIFMIVKLLSYYSHIIVMPSDVVFWAAGVIVVIKILATSTWTRSVAATCLLWHWHNDNAWVFGFKMIQVS